MHSRSFRSLSSSDRCCQRRAIFTGAGGGFEQLGQPVGARGGHRNVTSLATCQEACLRQVDCTTISFDAANRHCVLCAACELRRSFDGNVFHSQILSETSVDWSGAAVAAFISPAWLQGAYSTALYGAKGRVDVERLRVVWLNLLPRAALHFAAFTVGICLGGSMPPHRPFHVGRDPFMTNPIDALWITSPRPRPIESHEWVEVTHCAAAYNSTADQSGPAWKVA